MRWPASGGSWHERADRGARDGGAGPPRVGARATRVGGGRASEVFLVQGGDSELIAYWLPEGGAREARRRYALLERLSGQFRLAPRPLAVDEDGDAALLLVEKLDGVAPAACGALGPDTVRRLAENFIETLASLHALEVEPADRPRLSAAHPE